MLVHLQMSDHIPTDIWVSKVETNFFWHVLNKTRSAESLNFNNMFITMNRI